MRISHKFTLSCIASWVATCCAQTISCPDCEVITRDVAVIGGGSTGTYSAVRLRDQNYSVAVIEPKNHLGGHAETYTAPNNWTIDIGVIVFGQTDTVRNYFSRFNVTLTKLASGGLARPYIDYRTGRVATSVQAPSPADIQTGLSNFAAQLAKYPGLDLGFNLTYPIASDSDLLMPFGQFATKYNISGAMPTIFITNQGYAPILQIPTIYMFKYLNQGELDSFANGFLTTTNHNIQGLYKAANAWLGTNNVFLSSNITQISRTSNQTQILISTPSGRKLIVSKRVIITAAPTLTNLKDIPLTTNETSLFAQFYANGYYTGILTNTSLPANFSAENTDPNNPSQWNIPTLPALYSASANRGAPDHIQVYYGSPTVLPPSYVQSDIISSIQRVQRARGIPVTQPQWAIFSAHTPFNLMVSPAAIQDRFYEKLYALQGQMGTFWGGAAWETQDSSVIWRWVDAFLVPKVVASLKSG